MPRPSCSEAAYRAYCHALGLSPAYDTLSVTERLAWGAAAQASVQEALATPSRLELQRTIAHLPASAQTRRQQREYLQAQAQPGEKVCRDCLQPRPPLAYYPQAHTRDRLDTYCQGCRARRDQRNYHRRKAKKVA